MRISYQLLHITTANNYNILNTIIIDNIQTAYYKHNIMNYNTRKYTLNSFTIFHTPVKLGF